MNIPSGLFAGIIAALTISHDSTTIRMNTSSNVDTIIESSAYKNPNYWIQKIQKEFPDGLNHSALIEKLIILEETIRDHEDIIQGQLDDPARDVWMKLIEKQNKEIEVLGSREEEKEINEILYKKYKNQLIELVIFIEKHTPQQTNQCRKSALSV